MSNQETIVNKEFILAMDEYRKPLSNKMMEEFARSPIVFSEYGLGVKLRSWQIKASIIVMDICNETDPVKRKKMFKKLAILTSRQIGKSEWLAIMSIWLCVFNKYPGDLNNNLGKNTVVALISATDEQAKKLLKRTRRMYKRGDKFIANKYRTDGVPDFGTSFFTNLIDETENNNTSIITFKPWAPQYGLCLKGSESGSSISSLPPTGKTLGETYSVYFLDEAGRGEYISDSFHDDDLYPTGDALDALRIYLSTPWQNSGFFYKMVNPDGLNDNTGTVVLMFTIEAIQIEAPDQYDRVLVEINNKRLNGMFDEVRRAYYCEFVRGEKSYFDPAQVHSVFRDYEMVESYSGECDVGIDFGGQVKSCTVFTISKLGDDGTITRLYHKKYPVQQDKTLMADLEEALRNFNIQRLIPDDCPAGHFLIREMVDKGWNVQPMNFRSDKVKKYGAFRACMGRRKVESYQDNALRIEMLGLGFSNAAKQSLIEHAPGGSDDLIDSFLMSAYFFVQEENEFQVHDIDDASDDDPFLDEEERKEAKRQQR